MTPPPAAPATPNAAHHASDAGNGCGCGSTGLEAKFNGLLSNNKTWAAEQVAKDPTYFSRLQAQQAPEYLWIGCADSRVPANQVVGLAPGEVFVQRNVGNQAMHTDMNVMACLEYAVTALKVKVIICCGHYGCGAVKGALSLPSKTQGLVNCWISDIRECRNQHHAELKALPTQEERTDRLCELNVIRQTFHVCTSPVVQKAWDEGQDLVVFGAIYSLKDGIMKKLVGPLTRENACHDIFEFEHKATGQTGMGASPLNMSRAMSLNAGPKPEGKAATADDDERASAVNTAVLASRVFEHTNWDAPKVA